MISSVFWLCYVKSWIANQILFVSIGNTHLHSHTNTHSHGVLATKNNFALHEYRMQSKGSNYKRVRRVYVPKSTWALLLSNIYRYSRDACTSSIYNQDKQSITKTTTTTTATESSNFIHGHLSLLYMQRIAHSHRFSSIPRQNAIGNRISILRAIRMWTSRVVIVFCHLRCLVSIEYLFCRCPIHF